MIEKSKRAIADAYGEMLDAEIEAILASAPKEQHIFSDGFEKKMNALINNAGSDEDGHKTEESVPVKRRKVRKLWLIAAAILALAAAACAVPEVRKSIAGFFIKTFSDHVEYSDPDITKTSIEEEYELNPIPEGFSVTYYSNIGTDMIIKYMDTDEALIRLLQSANPNGVEMIDAERGDFTYHTVDGKEVRLYSGDDGSVAVWIDNGYYFSLFYTEPKDQELLEHMMSLVKPRQFGIEPLPSGFSKTEEKSGETNIRICYEDSAGNLIVLYKYADSIGPQVVDNKGEFIDREIAGRKVSICSAPDYSEAAWIEDGYYFVLSCVYSIELSEFEELIASVKV